MLDIGFVAAMLMPPRAQASTHLVAAVGHLPDQRLGDGEDASRASGEIDVVMDVCARQLAKLGRRECPHSVPSTGVDVHFWRR